MPHIVHLIERRHPRHAGWAVPLPVALSACGLLAAIAVLPARH